MKQVAQSPAADAAGLLGDEHHISNDDLPPRPRSKVFMILHFCVPRFDFMELSEDLVRIRGNKYTPKNCTIHSLILTSGYLTSLY